MLERILSRPIEQLVVTGRPLPNIEILRLYRDVMKFTSQFYWNNGQGECWRDILRKAARKEFDQSRMETDNIHIMKMVMTTRASMDRIRDQLFETQRRLEQTIVSEQQQQHS